jgi:tetratricopeptide (TPR) repeat protein
VGGASVIRDVLYYYPGLKINKSRYAWEFNMLQKGGKLRCALLDRDRNAAARHSHQWKTGREEQSYFAGDFCFLRGKYLLAEWKLSGAMEMIKRSIMLYQAGDDASGLCRANAELGIVMLGQKNLQDAKNYFGIARKSVDPSRDISAYLRSYILEIISLFLQGNYTRVLDYLPSIKETAESISVRKWFLYLSFLEGRTYMELGRYTEAENLFSLGMTYCRIYRDPEALEVLYRWFARAMIYNGKIHEGLFILKDRVRTRESLFFMAEAYTLLGEHRLGFSAAREALDLSRNHIFFTTEPVPWENGFSFMEDLTMEDEKEERVLDRFIRALSGYLKAVVQDFDEGIEDMKRLTRGRHQWELDPFWSIYYFLYAELLPEAGDGRFEDKVTVLGKSVKFFQERSSRIDRFTDKNSFMKQNYWNSRILKSAKEHNLV